MSKELYPSPDDKHADDPKQAVKADKQHTKLEKGLEDTFTASDAEGGRRGPRQSVALHASNVEGPEGAS